MRAGIKEFLRYELSGWKKPEVLGLVFVFSLIFFNAVTFKDSLVAVVSAVCGILYTMLAGKGKISCYLFGLCGSSCYVYLAFTNLLFGNMILYACYYIPMQILGIFKWRNNLKNETHEIIKTKLKNSERILLGVSVILLSIIACILLKRFNDANPYIDGITTVLSIAGMYLTVKRCIEQWVLWTVVNGLSFLMWLEIILNGTKAYATVTMWAFYFILSIYFLYMWKKEISEEK